MSRLTGYLGWLVSLTLLFGAVGCEDQNAKLAKENQQGKSAADRIAELEKQLAQVEGDRAAGQDQIRALQNEIARLKGQLAQAQPTEGWTSVPGGAMISIEGTVLFDSGKAQIKTGGKGVLNDVANAINSKYANHEIYVFGHTDNEPIKKSGWKDNYELSCQRALSVLRYLRGKGTGQPIAACGWGEDRPVSDNASANSRQANRRVQIFAMIPKGNATAQASPSRR